MLIASDEMKQLGLKSVYVKKPKHYAQVAQDEETYMAIVFIHAVCGTFRNTNDGILVRDTIESFRQGGMTSLFAYSDDAPNPRLLPSGVTSKKRKHPKRRMIKAMCAFLDLIIKRSMDRPPVTGAKMFRELGEMASKLLRAMERRNIE